VEPREAYRRLREIYELAEYGEPSQGKLDAIANLAVSEDDPTVELVPATDVLLRHGETCPECGYPWPDERVRE